MPLAPFGIQEVQGPAAAAITVAASPFTYTNNDGFREVVAIYAGTVSVIALVRGGVTTQVAGATNFPIMLEPGDGVTVTYSSAPTMVKYG
jgi:hypothetical protein